MWKRFRFCWGYIFKGKSYQAACLIIDLAADMNDSDVHQMAEYLDAVLQSRIRDRELEISGNKPFGHGMID